MLSIYLFVGMSGKYFAGQIIDHCSWRMLLLNCRELLCHDKDSDVMGVKLYGKHLSATWLPRVASVDISAISSGIIRYILCTHYILQTTNAQSKEKYFKDGISTITSEKV